jgi:hypothetical protein
LCKRCEKEEGKVDLLRGRSVVKRFVPVTSVAALLLMLVFAGCGGGGQDETASSGGAGNSGADEVSVNEGEFNDEETAGEIPEKQPVKQDGAAPAEGEAQEVGGFVVEGADGVELVRVPEVSVDQESAQRYLEEVRPILNESARDVSGAFTPRARLEDGQIRLEVQEDPVREAREAAQSGLERLQGIEVPEGLEPIQEQLVGSYERALGAYDNINDAFASGDVGRLDAAVRENLPRIEQLNDVGNSVVQDLERAANGAEGSA